MHKRNITHIHKIEDFACGLRNQSDGNFCFVSLQYVSNSGMTNFAILKKYLSLLCWSQIYPSYASTSLYWLNDNPTCRKCGTEKETSAHILCECEALA